MNVAAVIPKNIRIIIQYYTRPVIDFMIWNYGFFFSELEETVVAAEEPPICESPEPMSCYLHHDPNHPISSFSVINKMRVNIQVRQIIYLYYNKQITILSYRVLVTFFLMSVSSVTFPSGSATA